MATVSFDGPGKCVIISFNPGEVSASLDFGDDIYSRWKDWVLQGNAQYEQAMLVIGGQDKGGGKRVGSTFFLLNGWLLCPNPAEPTTELEVIDEVLPEIAGNPVYSTMLVNAGQSMLTQRTVPSSSETIEVGSAVLPSDVTDIAEAAAEAVWTDLTTRATP